MNPKKIVITGGPSTGKTMLIEALVKAGYYCYPEVIRTMTLKAKEEGELSNFSTNPIAAVSNPMEFNKKILEARLKHYVASLKRKDPVVFFDRGMPDILAYMNYYNQRHEPEFTKTIKKNTYDTIFLLPIWKEIYVRDNERFETFDEALKIHDYLKKTYQDLGYRIVEVPKTSIAKRTRFILKTLDC